MRTFAAAICLLLSTAAPAQQAVQTVDALNARCEAARQQKLAPIRERKIAECERSAQKPTAGCATFYSTYGDNSAHANGSVVRGRFYDLPECRRANRAAQRLLQKQNF